MTIFTKNSNGYLIAQYKFDKSIHENLIPIFNTEFINYDIIDEPSDNIIIRSIYSTDLPTTISFEEQKSLIEKLSKTDLDTEEILDFEKFVKKSD